MSFWDDVLLLDIFAGLRMTGRHLFRKADTVEYPELAGCAYDPARRKHRCVRLCASDPDPYLGPFPREGDHVWMEGRHVLDLQHSSQAELHPLYRWGIINP